MTRGRCRSDCPQKIPAPGPALHPSRPGRRTTGTALPATTGRPADHATANGRCLPPAQARRTKAGSQTHRRAPLRAQRQALRQAPMPAPASLPRSQQAAPALQTIQAPGPHRREAGGDQRHGMGHGRKLRQGQSQQTRHGQGGQQHGGKAQIDPHPYPGARRQQPCRHASGKEGESGKRIKQKGHARLFAHGLCAINIPRAYAASRFLRT